MPMRWRRWPTPRCATWSSRVHPSPTAWFSSYSLRAGRDTGVHLSQARGGEAKRIDVHRRGLMFMGRMKSNCMCARRASHHRSKSHTRQAQDSRSPQHTAGSNSANGAYPTISNPVRAVCPAGALACSSHPCRPVLLPKRAPERGASSQRHSKPEPAPNRRSKPEPAFGPPSLHARA